MNGGVRALSHSVTPDEGGPSVRTPDEPSYAAAARVGVAYGARYCSQRCGIFGVASRMNSTGAGGRGRADSSIWTSCGRRLPLRRLHGAHDVTTFSHVESPPFDRGITWSSVSRPLAVPQYTHRQLSRANSARREIFRCTMRGTRT